MATNEANPPLRAALVGAGAFGRTLLTQSRRLAGLSIQVLCDLDPGRAIATAKAAGFDDDEILRAGPGGDTGAELVPGRILITDDADALAGLPVDLLVEATGQPEAGARHALAAIGAGQHVAMVTKETDIVVGPILARLAAEAGRSYTLVDGDQPSLLIKLCAHLRTLGFPIVAAGKATEHDVVADPSLGTAECRGQRLDTPNLRRFWELDPDAVAATLSGRADCLAGAIRQTVPDLCELGIVANWSDLAPDRPEMHAPFLRPGELPEVFRETDGGGILACAGRVAAFVCLRRRDELGFAGGVFAVVDCDPELGALLAAKGLPVSRDGRRLMVHNPVHLLGAEAAISLLETVEPRRRGPLPRPRVDLAGVTAEALTEGQVLALGERHALPGVAPRLVPAAPLGPSAPLPYYLAAGARLRRDLAPGTTITLADVALPEDSILLALRRRQDEAFRDPTGKGRTFCTDIRSLADVPNRRPQHADR
ncbi:MAG: homoserine dehydrogenase [Kiloniellales bacterium]|nr:homoserine dehydrogenase [Kiloniellales bacterium]